MSVSGWSSCQESVVSWVRRRLNIPTIPACSYDHDDQSQQVYHSGRPARPVPDATSASGRDPRAAKRDHPAALGVSGHADESASSRGRMTSACGWLLGHAQCPNRAVIAIRTIAAADSIPAPTARAIMPTRLEVTTASSV